jgi:AraC-like DNA-binding protein
MARAAGRALELDVPSPPAFKSVRWSTDDVAARDRFDFYASALSSAIAPMSVERPPAQDFSAEMVMSDLGGMSVVRQRGSAHRCFAASSHVARNEGEHNYHLLVNIRSGWDVDMLGRVRMAPGEVIVTDSSMPWDIDIGSDYEFVHLKMGESWLRQWLSQPAALVGRRIAADSAWGRALASFVAPLSQDFLEKSPLPVSMVVDHVGSLLALAAQDMQLVPAPAPMQRAEHALLDRIKDCMRQLCSSPTLTATEVATAVDISLRTFHRSFQRAGETFGNTLTQMRCVYAIRMLQSPLFRRVGVGEIARRAGFCDVSHFARVVRSRTGLTPSQIRKGEVASHLDEEVAEGHS